MIIKTIFITFLSLNLNAAIIKHDILNAKFEEFTFKEVCEKLGAKNLELIEAKSESEIDCMGKVFPAINFCLNKFPLEKTLTRAIVDDKTKKVKCEMSASVMISVSCDKTDLKYCFEPEKGCEQLKKIYANRLSIAHFSMLEKNLNCYFAKPYGETLNESRL
ncbi:MAG: hypothetical protein H7177_00340 [Rhizobacter sp.]|nr:hypothetical protein [Bacteriovorax sp.]